ncbi:hypothetical protein D9M68_979620 [compost metagenome]
MLRDDEAGEHLVEDSAHRLPLVTLDEISPSAQRKPKGGTGTDFSLRHVVFPECLSESYAQQQQVHRGGKHLLGGLGALH